MSPTNSPTPTVGTCSTAPSLDGSSAYTADSYGTSYSASLAGGTGSNRLLVVRMVFNGSSDTTAAAVTWNNVGLAHLYTVSVGATYSPTYYQVWYLTATASGTNTLAVNFASATNFTLSAVWYTGVNQSDPLGTHQDNANQSAPASYASGITTTAPNSLISDFLVAGSCGGTSAISPGSGQSLEYAKVNCSSGDNDVYGDDIKAASQGAYNFTYGLNPANGSDWNGHALEILGVACTPDTPTSTPTPGTLTPTPEPSPTAGPRLVGYLPDYDGSYATFAHTLDFSKMTDLMLCFALPPACNGTCTSGSSMAFALNQTDADIATLVNAAHAAGVKVMVSIGGGDDASDQQISGFYNAGLSAQLVASLDSFVTAHNLDGVDVDIEDPGNMGAPYATFVADLIATEHSAGREVSAAVAYWLQSQNVMSNATLQSFDFVNVMVYSNLTDCQTDMSYFSSLGEPANKMVLGVPFYGQAASGDEETYATIIAAYPNAGQSNSVSGGSFDGGETFTYVGDAEMAQETQLGVQYGGAMIWELSQDAPSPNSLLTIIQNNL